MKHFCRYFTLLEVLVGGLLTGLIVTLALTTIRQGMDIQRQEKAQQRFQRQSRDFLSTIASDLRTSACAPSPFFRTPGNVELKWHGSEHELVITAIADGKYRHYTYAIDKRHPESKQNSERHLHRTLTSPEGDLLKKKGYDVISQISFAYAPNTERMAKDDWSKDWQAYRGESSFTPPAIVRVNVTSVPLPENKEVLEHSITVALPGKSL